MSIKEKNMKKKNSLKKFFKYVEICNRAGGMGIIQGDRIDALMDIESADMVFHLKLDELLKADDLNFKHDFCGIQNNIRGTFPARDFGLFVPRFAGKE